MIEWTTPDNIDDLVEALENNTATHLEYVIIIPFTSTIEAPFAETRAFARVCAVNLLA